MNRCIVCNEKVELRMGYCWRCAEVQSIIAEGKDMRDVGDGGKIIPANQADQRIKLLLERGYLK